MTIPRLPGTRSIKAAAILATDGTIQSGLYHKELKDAGITPVQPDAEDQKVIMSVIYDYVKAGRSYPYPEKIGAMQARLAEQGAEIMILGCTELPLFFAEENTKLPTVDPTQVLARAAIRYAGGTLKE